MYQPAESSLHSADEESPESRYLSVEISQMVSKLGQAALEVISDEPEPRVTYRSLNELSVSERSVFEMLGQGFNAKEISDFRGTGLQATKSHLTSIYGKLELRDRTDAALLAAEIQSDLLKQKETRRQEASLYIKTASILTELGVILPNLQPEIKANLVVLQGGKPDILDNSPDNRSNNSTGTLAPPAELEAETSAADLTQADSHAEPKKNREDKVSKSPANPLEALSTRERDVVGMVLQGATNDVIALKMQLSPSTVKYHLAIVYSKLNVSRRKQLKELFDPATPTEPENREEYAVLPGAGAEPETAPISQGKSSSERVDLPPPPEKILSSLGIRAARQIVRMLPPGGLASLEKMNFNISDPELLDVLHRINAISAEELESKEVGVEGTAIALILKSGQAKELLTGNKAAANARIIHEAVRDELAKQADIVSSSRRGGSGR